MCETSNWKKPSMVFCILLFVGVCCVGCTKSTAVNNDPDSGGDTDVDSNSDTDIDTDVDTDTETDPNEYGQLVWAKRAGGSSPDYGMALSALPDGSVLVTGHFFDTATFGLGEINEITYYSDVYGESDVFVAKYDEDGTLVWVKRAAGGNFSNESWDISALPDGSALVTGLFEGTVSFGPDETNETPLNSDGQVDIFVTKYNPDGTLAWAKSAGGSYDDMGLGISALSDGSALVTGYFWSTVTFGPDETNETVLTSDGDKDIFIAMYKEDGTLAWAKRAGGSEPDLGMGISALSDDSALVTGVFCDPAVFGPGETNETVLDSNGSCDIFLAKYNPDGTLAWVKRAGGAGSDAGYDISVLYDDSALVTGYFAGTATFGPGETNQTVMSAEGSYDIFVAKYNADGTLAWAKRAGGTDGDNDGDSGWGISALYDGSSFVTGRFEGTATFGQDETNETILNSEGDDDIFVAKYNTDGTLAWAKRVGGIAVDDFCHGMGISSLPDGSALVTGYFADAATFGQGEINETILSSDGLWDIFVAKFGP